MKKRILIALLFAFLIGCRTIPMATENNPTLLVGKVSFTGKSSVIINNLSFDGTSTRGIQILLRNTATNEFLRFSPDNNGLFHISLPDGTYSLDDLYIRKYNDRGAWASIFTRPLQKLIEVERGKVNNIGTILWTFEDRRHRVEQIDNSAAVREAFFARYARSNWNQQEWKYTSLFSDESIEMTVPFGENISFGEDITFYLRSEDGQDSIRMTIPENMPIEIRESIEREMRERMRERNELRALGDTIFYVRSDDGLDSVRLQLPRYFPNEIRQRMEENTRNRLRERQEQSQNE